MQLCFYNLPLEYTSQRRISTNNTCPARGCVCIILVLFSSSENGELLCAIM